MPVKLAEVYRGRVLESTHAGSIVAADSKGNILFTLGEPERKTFFHSAAKPLQSIAALEAGAVEKFGFDLKEIAIMMSSHSGQKEHIETLHGIMAKLGINEDTLQCGIHEPLDKEEAKELRAAGLLPTKLHCNCSGKHLSFIAASLTKGLPVEEYHFPDRILQNDVRKVISDFGRLQYEDIITGIDGCSVPVYGMPLVNMAIAYANLCSEDFLDGRYKKSQNYILSAMTMYPEMIAGRDRFDTEAMKFFGDRLITKMGAEGICCIGLVGKGTGIAIKIEDGSARAVEPVALETLLQMKILSQDEAVKLEKHRKPQILSHKGEKIGEVVADFKLS